jgi:cell division protein FtsB
METITIPKAKFEQLKETNKRLEHEVESLRNTKLYKRLLECLENLKEKEYTREDVGI